MVNDGTMSVLGIDPGTRHFGWGVVERNGTRLVHRGHGIFDTASIEAGKIYDLEAHLDRFIRSARNSRLTLPTRDEANTL